jgi:lipoate-protein ligase A
MLFYDLSLKSPSQNLAVDDMLLKQAENGSSGEALRLWESPVPCVVLGRISSMDDVLMENCRRDHVEVLRRSSGGGTVVQGPGCLNFSFVLSKKHRPRLNDLHRSYQEILFPVIHLLQGLGISAVFQPVSDLALADNDKKFSGNAQKRGRDFILHHGTLLYHFDLSLIERYLAFPKTVPDYRAGRPHADFVTNLNVPAAVLKEAFYANFPCEKRIIQLSDEQQRMMAEMEK